MAEPPTVPAAAAPEYRHPKRQAPKNWVQTLRTRLPDNARRRKLFDLAARPVDEPTEFTVAEDRAAAANARATTLQGAVGIAATLLLTGAGLIIGKTALHGVGWVAVFTGLLLAATASLVMSGLRALGAASTIHQWYEPSANDIIERSQQHELDGRVALAASLLFCSGYNNKVASWKIAYLGASAWWYRIALAFIISTAILIGAYAIEGAVGSTSSPGIGTTTTTTSGI
jgi:hypothetical protein